MCAPPAATAASPGPPAASSAPRFYVSACAPATLLSLSFCRPADSPKYSFRVHDSAGAHQPPRLQLHIALQGSRRGLVSSKHSVSVRLCLLRSPSSVGNLQQYSLLLAKPLVKPPVCSSAACSGLRGGGRLGLSVRCQTDPLQDSNLANMQVPLIPASRSYTVHPSKLNNISAKVSQRIAKIAEVLSSV